MFGGFGGRGIGELEDVLRQSEVGILGEEDVTHFGGEGVWEWKMTVQRAGFCERADVVLRLW